MSVSAVVRRDRHATALARTDLDGAEWRGHPVASEVSRGGDGDEPVVLVRVAHGQAQVVGERMAGTERARDEAASRGAPRPPSRRARREPKSTSRKFVTDGPTDQPDATSASRRRVALAVDAGEVGVEDRRDRAAPRSRRVTDTVDTEPGGRIRVERGDQLGPGDGEPDPQPGQRVGLARRADDDQVRDSRRAARRAIVPTNSA